LRNIYVARDSTHFKQIFKLKYFIVHLFFYLIHLGIFGLAVIYSPSNIMSTHPRRVNCTFAFIFIQTVHRMQYTHVTLERFNPFRRSTLITWALVLAQTVFSIITKGESLFNEPVLYLALSLLTFCSMSHLIYYVIDELKDILNIYVFVITRPLRLTPSDKKEK
jgi:hypothetical protein